MKVEEAQILSLHEDGLSARQIAAELNITPRTVQRWRVRLGVALERAPVRDEADHQLALRMLEEGCSYREIAATIGVSDVTVAGWFPGRGWTKQQAGEWAALMRRQTVL